uniref:F-box domain-containing protein n=1 Tax=Panagrellus redivivus TaxID=6233 RepID=A0A7E4ZQ45_PANRE
MLNHLDIHNLANTNYQFFSRLIEFMSVETLYHARHVNAEIKRFSNRRSESVDSLLVERGNPHDQWNITYSQMINRPRQLTPVYHLSVNMSPNIIDPAALVAKMEKQVYRTLHIYGKYHWQQILDFFHPNLTCVKLFGVLDPPNDVMDFFKALLGYTIQKVIVINANANWDWIDRAYTAWKLSTNESFQAYHHLYYYRLVLTGTDNVKRIVKLRTWENLPEEPADHERSDDEDSDDAVFSDGEGEPEVFDDVNIDFDALDIDDNVE